MPWSSYSACAVNDTATARDVQHSPLHYYHFFAIIFTRPYTRTGADPSSTHPSRRIDSATTTTHVSTPRKHVRCASSGTCATHSGPRQATTPAAQLGGGGDGVYLHTAIVGATGDDAAADVKALDCLAVHMRNGCAHTHATKVEHSSVWRAVSCALNIK